MRVRTIMRKTFLDPDRTFYSTYLAEVRKDRGQDDAFEELSEAKLATPLANWLLENVIMV